MLDHGGSPDHQHAAQSFVAGSRDNAEPDIARGRMILRRQADPGGELPPRSKHLRRRGLHFQQHRADRADARDLDEPGETASARKAVADMIRFCIETSPEEVRMPHDGRPIDVITALMTPPHSRMSKFFWQLKSDLGFGLYVPDCDTTVCSFSAATQFGSDDPILEQPLLDFFADYQVANGNQDRFPTVTINDNIKYDGGIVSWIENGSGDRPFGNDLDRSDAKPRCFGSKLPQSRALADHREPAAVTCAA